MEPRPLMPSDGLRPDPYGAHEMPIYQTSTFVFDSTAVAAARFAGDDAGFVYTRLANPTVAAWEQRVAALETEGTGLEAVALAFGSGMGAATTAVLASVRSGDHVAAARPLYGGTSAFFLDVLPRFGVTVTHVRAGDADGLAAAAAVRRTKVVYVETPANPTLDVVDIAHAAGVARTVGARLIVDNTFATPIFQKPLALGADLVVQSSTKYLGGHGSVVGGAVIGGDREHMAGAVLELRKIFGSVPSPFDAWLLLQGVKTLRLRVERAAQTARRLAAELAQHKMVQWLRYPGLADDPGYEVAKRQMSGFGSMIAFELVGGAEAGRRFLDSLAVCKRAVSLGCTDTLIEHPASMTHAHLSPEERAAAGITDGLIRLSVGLEDPQELERDLLAGLELLNRPQPGSGGSSPSPRAATRRAPRPETSRS